MKICFLAPANNYHTKKWCKWFSEHGHIIHVISFVDDKIDNAVVHCVETGVFVDSSDSQKIKYLLKAKQVKRIIKKINPDIVNVHYATSYGSVAALSGIKGYILSLWGTDIYDFPNHSIFHKYLLKYSLKKAKYILSTSNAMAEEAKKYTSKDIYITPFGVDMTLFNPKKKHRKDKYFVVGTVKKLEPVYGIEYILNAVKLVINKRPDINLRVRIAGNGTHQKFYKEMAEKLKIDSFINWLGFISQEEAADEWANMDVAIIPSIRESFGVSAIEAQASATPVIISDIEGLKETTEVGKTSFSITIGDYYKIADLIIFFYDNQDKLRKMGANARKMVENKFEINVCFENIEDLFKKISLGCI